MLNLFLLAAAPVPIQAPQHHEQDPKDLKNNSTYGRHRKVAASIEPAKSLTGP
jgi:hypothetical protein